MKEYKKFCSANEHDAHSLVSWGEIPTAILYFCLFLKLISLSSAPHFFQSVEMSPQGAGERRTRDDREKGRGRKDERLFCILWRYWKRTAVFDASHGAFLLDCVSLNEIRRTG